MAGRVPLKVKAWYVIEMLPKTQLFIIIIIMYSWMKGAVCRNAARAQVLIESEVVAYKLLYDGINQQKLSKRHIKQYSAICRGCNNASRKLLEC